MPNFEKVQGVEAEAACADFKDQFNKLTESYARGEIENMIVFYSKKDSMECAGFSMAEPDFISGAHDVLCQMLKDLRNKEKEQEKEIPIQ